MAEAASATNQRQTATSEGLRLSSATGRWVLVACVLGSGIAFIDATVVNVALPAIGRDLHASFSTLQATITSYTVTLASLILLGGSLGDRFGRRRLYVIGTVWFAVASLLCAVATTATFLIVARALQGVGGALLTPASLAIIQASYRREDRARAIGAWSGLGGASAAIAPFLGGWLIQAGSWRYVFLINPVLCALVVAISLRHVPETRDENAAKHLDVLGSVLGVLGLGGVTAGIIAASGQSFLSLRVLLPFVVGVLALLAFLLVEYRERYPMLPLGLFRSRQFSAANAVTFLLYAGLNVVFFLLVVELQTVSGLSPLKAGAATLPATLVMLLLAARSGALATRIGPRLQMTVGPFIAAIGLFMLTRLNADSSYWRDVIPAVTILGLGLTTFVAPLTSTVLAAAPASRAGIASGVNNTVARSAGLIAVAAVPVIVGLTGDAYKNAALFIGPFHDAMWICVGLMIAGGVVSAFTISNDPQIGGDHKIPTCTVCPGAHPPVGISARPSDEAPTRSGAAP
jgi:EmrB/QacA subfamily drug resistance transporter